MSSLALPDRLKALLGWAMLALALVLQAAAPAQAARSAGCDEVNSSLNRLNSRGSFDLTVTLAAGEQLTMYQDASGGNSISVTGAVVTPVNSQYDFNLVIATGGSVRIFGDLWYIQVHCREPSADLTDLFPGAGTLSPIFDRATTNYTLTIPNGVATTTFEAHLVDVNASMTFQGQPLANHGTTPDVPTLNGARYSIIVTAAANAFTKTYTITISSSNNGGGGETADSQNLRSLVSKGTRIGAQAAGRATSSLVGSAIASSSCRAGGGYGSRASCEPSVAQADGVPSGASGLGMSGRNGASTEQPRSRLMPWVNGAVSDSFNDGKDGWSHKMIVGGLSYAAAPGLVVGAFTSLEKLDVKQDDDGKLDGSGQAAGAYFGWYLTRAVRLDAMVGHTWLDYDAKSGTASADFDARRWMYQTRLSGDYVRGAWTLTPSADVFVLHEMQDGFTDSLGSTRGDSRFTTGRANGGLQAAYAVPLSQFRVLSPYGGFYADYYFSSSEETSVSDAGVSEGWGVRATGGFTLSDDNAGWLVDVGGEAGNLGGEGAPYLTGRVHGRVLF